MAKVNVTNLTSGDLSLDLNVPGQDEAVRANIPRGGTVDIGDQATMDDLNKSSVFKQLIADGKISVQSLAESDDVKENLQLIRRVYLGQPVVADDDRIVTAVQIADGAQTVAAQPDTPRNITMQLTDANDSVTADVVATGVDPCGRTVTETMSPDGAGGGKTLTGTKIFASVTSVVVSNTAGSAVGDDLIVGVGDVIGLPTDIQSADAVIHTFLGAVPVTPDAVAVGESTSGVDANGATYDGSKVMEVIYNVGL